MSLTTDRVFTISRALRLGFGSWLRYLGSFTLISAVLHAPLLVWGLGLLDEPDNLAGWRRFSMWLNIGTHVVNGLLAAMIVQAVCARLDGQPASIGRVLATGVRRGLSALLVASLVGLLVGLGMIALFVPGLILTCMFFVATPASVVERPGVIGALRRSAWLTKGRRGAIFGLVVLLWVFVFVAAVATVVAFPDLVMARPHLTPLVQLVITVVFAPLQAAIAATTYVLLRREREGVDTATLVGVFD